MRRQLNHRSDISRRSLLHGAAGITSSLLVGCGTRGCASKPSGPLEQKKADVVIVGAGLSGLVAARDLIKSGVESVLVLEARDRVGGLTIGQEVAPGVVVDGGGCWISQTHTRILALAKELGVATTPTPQEGNPVFLFGGVRVAGFGRLFTNEEKKELRGMQRMVETMAKEFPAGEPWNAPRAAEYDQMSMFNWLRDNASTVWGRRDIELALDWKFGCRPEDISLLRFIAGVQAYGGLEPLMALSESQELMFLGGSQQLSIKLAEKLGERVLLSSPVTRIVDSPSGPLQVQTDKLSIECGRVIVAMMPADMRRIEFEPELPKKRHGLIADWKAAPSYKAHIVYETPFWRKGKLSGIAVGDGEVVDFVFDVTPPSGSPGILVAFGSGDELASDVRARKEAVVGSLVDYFAEDAREPLNFVDMDWYSEKWSSGCASPLGPKLLTTYGSALREPIGRIHWAGTDTAREFDGSMEGAVRSGEYVATEVAKVLRESGIVAAPAKSG